jgi:hypothetical protein
MELPLISLGPEIRVEAERELECVYRSLATCEVEMRDHEFIHIPAFRQWMALHCADLLDHRRLIEQKMSMFRLRLAAFHQFRDQGFSDLGEAYFWFAEIEREEMVIPPRVQRAWEQVTVQRTEAVEGAETSAQSERETFVDPIDDTEDLEDVDPVWSEEPGKSDPDKANKIQILERQCKEVYRKVVRLLHPDASGILSDREIELWHATQVAYENRDLIALEVILVRSDKVGTRHLTVWELRQRTLEAEQRLELMHRTLDKMRLEHSWRFCECSESGREWLLRDVRRNLESSIDLLSREAKFLERQIDFLRLRSSRWLTTRRERKSKGQLSLEI